MFSCIKCQWMVCVPHLWSDYFPPCKIKDQTFLVFSLSNQPLLQCNLASVIVTSHGVKVGNGLLLQVNNLQRLNSTKVHTCGVMNTTLRSMGETITEYIHRMDTEVVILMEAAIQHKPGWNHVQSHCKTIARQLLYHCTRKHRQLKQTGNTVQATAQCTRVGMLKQPLGSLKCRSPHLSGH